MPDYTWIYGGPYGVAVCRPIDGVMLTVTPTRGRFEWRLDAYGDPPSPFIDIVCGARCPIGGTVSSAKAGQDAAVAEFEERIGRSA